MNQIKYIAPAPMVGSGFAEEPFLAALSPDMAFIGCDAGSCDGGPSYLASEDKVFATREGVKRDLRILVKGARSIKRPLLIGSCGGSGANWAVDLFRDLVCEIAAEEGLHFKLATIYTEPDRSTLKERLAQGKVKPLHPAPAISDEIIDDCIRIVSMAGHEAFLEALDQGADVVLCGRATDASIFAAIPIREGFDPGLCWHAAKILECGSAAVTKSDGPNGMICTIEEDRFLVEPVAPHHLVSTGSVAAHALYETGDPFQMKEPGGTLILTDATYSQVSDRCVAVSGSAWQQGAYTLRLEAASLAGFQTMSIGGIRDPALLSELDTWLDEVRKRVRNSIERQFGWRMDEDYWLTVRCYGRDGVLGELEPERDSIGHEIGLLMTILASDQRRAASIASVAAHAYLHHTVPAWSGSVSNTAFPFSPHVVDLGPSYRFSLNHVVELDRPNELFDFHYEDI